MLNELAAIANSLDKSGYRPQADTVDLLIGKLAGSGSSRAVQDFIDDLKKAFLNVANSKETFPTISEKSLPEI